MDGNPFLNKLFLVSHKKRNKVDANETDKSFSPVAIIAAFVGKMDWIKVKDEHCHWKAANTWNLLSARWNSNHDDVRALLPV